MNLQISQDHQEIQSLSFDDLANQPDEIQIPDVSGLFPGREGAGVRFREFLLHVCPDQNTISSLELSSSHDQFHKVISWNLIPEEAVLLYQYQDKELPLEMGGPTRLLVPGTVLCGTAELDNCVNVKFLDRINIVTVNSD